MSMPAPASAPFSWAKLASGIVILFTLVLADNRLRFAWDYTPNVLFWDQWDLYNPLFQDEGWWSLFSYQHGPHRQGVGAIFTAALAHLTGWDSRGDALLTVGVTVAATFLALLLASRCGARPGLALAAVPVIFLTTRQFESWIGPANPSHGAFPLLLMMLAGLAWFIRAPAWRYAALAVLIFFLVFTGFGLFAGALGPPLLLLEAWRLRQGGAHVDARWAAAACAFALLAWALFFVGYKHQPAVADFQFPHDRPWEYLGFSALMLASYAGWHGHGAWDVVGGGVILALLTAITIVHGLRLWRASPSARPVSTVLFFFSAATVLFCLNTAVGRISLGWREAPYAPRYVTLIVPGIFALFLHAEGLKSLWSRHLAWWAIVVVSALPGIRINAEDRNAADWYRRGRERWSATYLAKGSLQLANAATSPDQGFTIHPGDISAKLEHLRRNKLNLFKPRPPY